MSIKFAKPLNDPFFEEMDPVLKLWYYNNWLADQYDAYEKIKDLGYLVGSFIDPNRVKDLLGGGNKHISSDEDFDESTKIIEEYRNVPINLNRPRGINGG